MKHLITGVLCILFILCLLGTPNKALADDRKTVEALSFIGRVITFPPCTIVRGSLFVVEGVLDGVIEGLFDHKGFLHGESKYI